MMHNSFNFNASGGSSTLSRAQTPNSTLGSAARPTPSPKCFGRNTHVLKEEYERERVRWQQKLEEAEQKLTEASINNSELFQIKAELNRKIIDFEKNQRPMIEQNRRLNERVRALNAELKELEKKLAFAQDDFLSLRDAYDRLVKENSVLKEQRPAQPEKLEELARYRNQVLEYSKCITALRQSAVEKDRRYEMIMQKFRKYRKVLSSRRGAADTATGGSSTSGASSASGSSLAGSTLAGSTAPTGGDDDRHSYIGSEGSMDSSLMGLDTITEDLDEDMEFSADLLQSPMTTVEFGLKQQLELANMTIIELQAALDSPARISSDACARLQDEVKQLQEARRQLETDLANAQHNNELLEFQLTELTEGLQHVGRSGFSDKQCGTDVQISPSDGEFTDVDFTLCKRVNVNAEEATAATSALLKILHSYAPVLRRDDFETIRKVIEIADALQTQVTFAETELNMLNCELSRLKRSSEEEISELRRQADENTTRKQQKKKELQAEIDQLKKERKDDAKKYAKQISDLESQVEMKAREVAEKTEQIRHLNGEIRVMSTKIESQSAMINANTATIDELRTQFETLSAELAGARSGLDAVRKSSLEENAKLSDALERMRRDSAAELEALRAENARLRVDKGVAAADFAAQRAELDARLRETLDDAEAERAEAEAQRRALERELSDARAQIHTLKDQIRPIGTQLERRYEESRYRLSEALKKIHELEQRLENGATGDGDAQLRLRYAQSEAYNRELQDQFNAQMELMNVLKKEIITLKAKKSTQSTDSIGWTSNSGSDSMDDEQYHSEESAEPGSGRRAASVEEKSKTPATPTTVITAVPVTRH